MAERTPDGAGPAGTDALAYELVRFVADTRASDAARSRSRERSLRQQATEMATFAGLLLDLVEGGASVTVRTTAGRVHQGNIVAVGRDFVLLRAAAGPDIYLKIEAVALLRRLPGARTED